MTAGTMSRLLTVAMLTLDRDQRAAVHATTTGLGCLLPALLALNPAQREPWP